MRSTRYHPTLAALWLAIALGVVGCGKTTVTGPSGWLGQESADDVALQTAQVTDFLFLDLDWAVTAGGPMSSLRPAGPARAALWDTSFAFGDLVIEANRDFYDDQDNLLAGYGPTAVKLVWTSRVHGTLESLRDTATIARSAVMEVRGIQPADTEYRFQGTSADTLLNRFRALDGSRMRYCYWRSSLTVAELVKPKASEWPLSGTVTLNVECDRLRTGDRSDVEAHFTATVVVTFDGTDMPRIRVNGTYRYLWNRRIGQIVRA